MAYISPALNVMIAAARKAGKPLIRDLGELENLQVSMKGPADFVTNADKRTEKILIDELTRVRPGYGFLAEESGTIEGKDKTHRFIIDPIDGTTNFLHGIPHFAISIALEREGQIVSALVYNPATDDMFVAEKGHGAYLNNKRLRVAARKTLAHALIGTGFPFHGHAEDRHTRMQAELATMMPATSGLRRMGAASLDIAYVAAGRFDAFWERGLAPWDVAAGILLVKESQGVVSDLSGGQNMLDGDILAANEALHPLLLKTLKAAK
ncbi:MAG TPA: inositol monophosphatase family protein [Rhizomicrobium sp.]|nr:inositol monophosphatase family protein [Rhizomicrobium sp.]